MSNRIILNNKDFQFDKSFLPCLVTGACKSGASFFSVTLIANLIQSGSKVIFFTAFPMAKEELLHQIGHNKTFEVTDESDIKNIPGNKSIIIQSGNKELWQNVMKNIIHLKDYIIFVKNIEEYDTSILETIGAKKNIILSGDTDRCSFKGRIAKKVWKSKIIFTAPAIDLHIRIPKLKKYESYLVSKNAEGILRLEN